MLTENQKYCKRVADEITAYYEGRAYRDTDGEIIATDKPDGSMEQLSLYDYLDDVLDVEYIVQSDRKTLAGVKVWITLGGPSVWIDTQGQTVDFHWGGECASWGIPYDAADEITQIYQDLWDCGC